MRTAEVNTERLRATLLAPRDTISAVRTAEVNTERDDRAIRTRAARVFQPCARLKSILKVTLAHTLSHFFKFQPCARLKSILKDYHPATGSRYAEISAVRTAEVNTERHSAPPAHNSAPRFQPCARLKSILKVAALRRSRRRAAISAVRTAEVNTERLLDSPETHARFAGYGYVAAISAVRTAEVNTERNSPMSPATALSIFQPCARLKSILKWFTLFQPFPHLIRMVAQHQIMNIFRS